jgi:hypothetical protein
MVVYGPGDEPYPAEILERLLDLGFVESADDGPGRYRLGLTGRVALSPIAPT